MKTITIYDLLGMVKDGNPPKKIKISELTYTFNDMCQSYYDEAGLELTDNICLLKNLDEPVEILEEEKKIPEKLPLIGNKIVNYPDDEFIERLFNLFYQFDDELRHKINEIIDYLDYLKSKGE